MSIWKYMPRWIKNRRVSSLKKRMIQNPTTSTWLLLVDLVSTEGAFSWIDDLMLPQNVRADGITNNTSPALWKFLIDVCSQNQRHIYLLSQFNAVYLLGAASSSKLGGLESYHYRFLIECFLISYKIRALIGDIGAVSITGTDSDREEMERIVDRINVAMNAVGVKLQQNRLVRDVAIGIVLDIQARNRIEPERAAQSLEVIEILTVEEFRRGMVNIFRFIAQNNHDELSKTIFLLHQATLQNAFVERPQIGTLTDLLTYVVRYDLEFSVANDAIRKGLMSLESWQIAPDYLRQLLLAGIEAHLYGHVASTQAQTWDKWLYESRLARRRIDMSSPIVESAFLEAFRTGKIKSLARAEYDYLLECYRASFASEMGSFPTSESRAALPLLLELTAIAHVLGPDDSYAEILQQWSHQAIQPPRALIDMNDEEADTAPISGVGSPHRMEITYLEEVGAATPTRIICAGTTADPALNSRIFTNLFAAALACESEPTLLTVNGCVLSLNPEPSLFDQNLVELRSIAVGPAGPVEPTVDTVNLGMTSEDAMLFVRGVFEKYQENTGLINVSHWETHVSNELDRRIAKAFESLRSDPFELDLSDLLPYEPGTVVAVPMLHRDSNGSVVALAIEMPYSVLGAETVYRLLQTARGVYLHELVTTARIRLDEASRARTDYEQRWRRWNQLSEEDKQQKDRSIPSYTISLEVDYVTGQHTKLEQPVEMSHREYMDTMLPALFINARTGVQRWAHIVNHIEKINQPQGLADTLTFKVLADAMLREATLPIEHTDFQSRYREWVDICRVPVWAVIQRSAEEHGFTWQELAADHVVFNARQLSNPDRVVIEPWLLIDLYQSTIQIDPEQGTMRVIQTQPRPTLQDELRSGETLGIADTRDLYSSFCDWFGAFIGYPDPPLLRLEQMEQHMAEDRRLYLCVQIERAKTILIYGDPKEAIALLNREVQDDQAPIYFWLAVAQIQIAVAQIVEAANSQLEVERNVRAERITAFSWAFRLVVERAWDLDLGDLYRELTVLRAYIQPTAWSLLERVRRTETRSPLRNYTPQIGLPAQFESDAFVQIDAWIGAHFELSQEDRLHISAYISSLRSIEFVKLAEAMESAARGLSFGGKISVESRRHLDQLRQRYAAVGIVEDMILGRIDELEKEIAKVNQRNPKNVLERLSNLAVRGRRKSANLGSPADRIDLNLGNIGSPKDNRIYQNVLEGMVKCASEVLATNRTLRDLFAVEPLNQWSQYVRDDAFSINSRALTVIDFLRSRKDRASDTNGLVLFLNILGDQKQKGDQCINTLRDLADSLEKLLSAAGSTDQALQRSLAISNQLVNSRTSAKSKFYSDEEYDVWDVAAIKSRLHTLSELLVEESLRLSDGFPILGFDQEYALLSTTVELRWHRGFADVLARLAEVPLMYGYIRDFEIEVSASSFPIAGGRLWAEITAYGDVDVYLNHESVARIVPAPGLNAQAVADAVNLAGEESNAFDDPISFHAFLGDIPIKTRAIVADPQVQMFMENQHVLIPLIARYGLPGENMLLWPE